MNFNDLKTIVGIASNVSVKSNMLRYSELRALVQQVRDSQRGKLTIIVKNGSLMDSEIKGLAELGADYVSFDFTQPEC